MQNLTVKIETVSYSLLIGVLFLFMFCLLHWLRVTPIPIKCATIKNRMVKCSHNYEYSKNK